MTRGPGVATNTRLDPGPDLPFDPSDPVTRKTTRRARPGGRAVPGLVLLAVCAGCASHPRFAGPMKVRNQHPAQLTVLHLDPRGVDVPPPGGAEAVWTQAYTNLFLAGSGGGGSFAMDGEVWRSALAVRAGLGARFDLGVELAAAHTTGGFLDDTVVGWHDLFDFPNNGRERQPENRFRITAVHRGATAWAVDEDGFEVLDVPITLGFNVLPITAERPVGVTLRAGLELPVGDDERGYGSGEVETALGLVAEWRTRWFALTAHAQHTFAGTPKPARRAGLRFRDVTGAGLGVEVPLDDRWTLLAQTEVETSTLRELGFDEVDDVQALLWTGLRARLGERWHVEFGLGEDLSPDVAPDFSLWFALGASFGG